MLRRFFLMCCVLLATKTFGAETPTITISKSDTIAIAVSQISGADGAAATKILQHDLALSGYFNITSPASAAFVAGGSSTGGGLQGKVTDHSGQTALASTYNGGERGKVHQFADDIIKTLTGNHGMANSKIAFVSTRTGRKEIYTADFDGSNVQQLTRDNNISVGPKLNPDGRKLVYTGYKSGYADVYSVDLGNGARERIVKFPGTNSGASFSPDGGQLAVTLSKDGNPELYVTGAGGGGAHRLTHTSGVESSPSWSPNGNEIVYSYDEHGGPQLYRISASGGSGRPVSTGHSYCTEPDWSPDGKKIAFNVREGGSFVIAVLDLASGQTRRLSPGERPAWGPDSRHILFSEDGGLYLLDAQTARKVKVLDGLGKISEPTWSH